MDKLARNVLRLSLAGAGVVVLGAGFVGQASAENTDAQDLLATENVATVVPHPVVTPDAG